MIAGHISTSWQHGEMGAATLEDNVDALAWQAFDLGHSFTKQITDKELIKRLTGGRTEFPPGDPRSMSFLLDGFGPNGPFKPVNIIFEGFGKKNAEKVANVVKQGARVIIIVTERPTGYTWNGIKDGQPGEKLRDRMRWFRWIAPQVEALWCFVPGTAEIVKALNPNAVDLEIGYSRAREKSFLEICKRKRIALDTPLYDFGFFGGLTERRKQIIEKMQKRGLQVHTRSKGKIDIDPLTGLPVADIKSMTQSDYGDIGLRNYEMVNCKVIIHPAAKAKWGIFSASRAVTTMHLMRPLVSEPTLPTIWNNIARFSQGFDESFIDECEKVLADWRTERDRQLERFREMLSPEKTLGVAIAETIEKRRAA